jgi:hypothetical protein
MGFEKSLNKAICRAEHTAIDQSSITSYGDRGLFFIHIYGTRIRPNGLAIDLERLSFFNVKE